MEKKETKHKNKNPLLEVPIMQHIDSEEPQRPYPSLEEMGISSARDCTGLIPSAPQSDAEIQNYKDMYHFEP